MAAALVNNILLYRNMTLDGSFDELLFGTIDWILGRNPWGVSQIISLPKSGVWPHFPQNSIAYITGRTVPGGLVDGPMMTTMWETMQGIELTRPDPYALFQSPLVVYHDDTMDYATNEPTMDGSAETIYFLSVLSTIL